MTASRDWPTGWTTKPQSWPPWHATGTEDSHRSWPGLRGRYVFLVGGQLKSCAHAPRQLSRVGRLGPTDVRADQCPQPAEADMARLARARLLTQSCQSVVKFAAMHTLTFPECDRVWSSA
jgi:hypothetical protein